MADEPPVPGSDDEIDLEELIGNVLEKRGFTVDRASKLDALDSLGDNLGKRVEDLFRASNTGGGSQSGSQGTPAPFDADGFLAKVGEMVDAKLKGIAVPGTTPPPGTAVKKVPPMFRFLGVKSE